MKNRTIKLTLAGAIAFALPASGSIAQDLSPQSVADMLHSVMAADRTVYTRRVVNRLMNEEDIIDATEHFDDDGTLPLPAQMFRFGAKEVADQTDSFSYSLLSLWPINTQNNAKTDVEEEGLQYVFDNPGENFYGKETLGGQNYFTAVYGDPAVAEACVTCHNDHPVSPKTDFELGDVMGGVVIRIPVSG